MNDAMKIALYRAMVEKAKKLGLTISTDMGRISVLTSAAAVGFDSVEELQAYLLGFEHARASKVSS